MSIMRSQFSPNPTKGRPRRMAIPLIRARIHPFFLIPFFILGAFFSPFGSTTNSHLHHQNPSATALVYTPTHTADDTYDWTKESFLPPDAPPLIADDDEEEEGAISYQYHKRSNRGTGAILFENGAGGLGQKDVNGDILGWKPPASTSNDEYSSSPSSQTTDSPSALLSSSDSPNSESSRRGQNSMSMMMKLTPPSYFAELDGYLYYPPSAPLVNIKIPRSSSTSSNQRIPPPLPPRLAAGAVRKVAVGQPPLLAKNRNLPPFLSPGNRNGRNSPLLLPPGVKPRIPEWYDPETPFLPPTPNVQIMLPPQQARAKGQIGVPVAAAALAPPQPPNLVVGRGGGGGVRRRTGGDGMGGGVNGAANYPPQQRSPHQPQVQPQARPQQLAYPNNNALPPRRPPAPAPLLGRIAAPAQVQGQAQGLGLGQIGSRKQRAGALMEGGKGGGGLLVGPQGQRLGPNAAAMAAAVREGKPFRPGKPIDLIKEFKQRSDKDRLRREADRLENDRLKLWKPVVDLQQPPRQRQQVQQIHQVQQQQQDIGLGQLPPGRREAAAAAERIDVGVDGQRLAGRPFEGSRRRAKFNPPPSRDRTGRIQGNKLLGAPPPPPVLQPAIPKQQQQHDHLIPPAAPVAKLRANVAGYERARGGQPLRRKPLAAAAVVEPKRDWRLVQEAAPQNGIQNLNDEDDEELYEEDDGDPQTMNDKDEEMDDVDEDEDLPTEFSGDDSDEAALIAAMQGLTPDERAILTAEELAFVEKVISEASQDVKDQANQLVYNNLEIARSDERVARRQARKVARVGNAALAVDRLGDSPADRIRRLRKRAAIFEPPPPSIEEPQAEAVGLAEKLNGQKASGMEDQPLDAKASPEKSPIQSEGSPDLDDHIHPIAYLVREAEKKWNDMLRRQSQTIESAVVEYKRRYGRHPPRGFDAWWRFAMENRVVLVDEYDQINEDIEPFLSLPSVEVRARAKQLETDRTLPHHKNSFSISIKEGLMSTSGPGKLTPTAEDLQDVMAEFSKSLPDMTITFGSKMHPVVAITGEAKARHLDYARRGVLLDKVEANEILDSYGHQNWQKMCPTNSTARKTAGGQAVNHVPIAPSFVSTAHTHAMDVCRHPDIQYQNGFTAWNGPNPYLLYPMMSWSKTSMHGDLLNAPLEDYYEEVGHDVVWENKVHNKILWRGSASGTYHKQGLPWRSSQRSRLVLLTNDQDGTREVRFADRKVGDSVRRFIGSTGDVNHHYFDVAFVGAPVQCDHEDQTCEALRQDYRFESSMSKEATNKYKYVLNVDGNGWSGKFHRMMSSRSLVFKSTIFPEWYSKRVMPWYHYIPIKTDYSDLTDVAAFFIGAPDGTGSHDALAKQIAMNGKIWADNHWRETDIAAYQFRLYLEYARLIGREDGDSYDFVLTE